MSNISFLEDFSFLGGVRHVCVVKNGAITGSTFPALLNDSVKSASRMMQQMLSGIQPLEQDHNEIHIEMDDSLLVGYRLSDEVIFVLMTDRDINQALISTTVRSSKERLVALETTTESAAKSKETHEPQASNTDSETKARKTAAKKVEIAENLKPVLKNMAMILAEYIGPAATVLFQRTYTQWTQEGTPSLERLPQLADLIAEYIDSEDKHAEFLSRTHSLLQQQNRKAAKTNKQDMQPPVLSNPVLGTGATT